MTHHTTCIYIYSVAYYGTGTPSLAMPDVNDATDKQHVVDKMPRHEFDINQSPRQKKTIETPRHSMAPVSRVVTNYSMKGLNSFN